MAWLRLGRFERLMAFFGLIVLSCPAGAESLGPISEETPPAVCDIGFFLRGIRCTGAYCDNIRIGCYRPQLPDAVVRRALWTRWFSEEQGRMLCPANFAVAGLACRGQYCDSISLYCVEIPNTALPNCADTPFVSEEKPRGITVFDNPNNDKAGQIFVATGLTCNHDYCDNVSLHVCEP
jgi:hypothetical protein